MIKEWKVIDGATNKYCHVYMVSNYGEVINASTGKMLSTRNNFNEYARVCIGGNEYRVHILVASAFIDNPENKDLVNHIDGVKSNNIVTNLEWATTSENMRHAYANNLKKAMKGELNPRSILSKDDVFDIWLNFYTVEYINEHFGLTKGSARQLLHRQTWRHLVDEFDALYPNVYDDNLNKFKIKTNFSTRKKKLSDEEAYDFYIEANRQGVVLSRLCKEYNISEATAHAIKNKNTSYIKRILLERGELDEIN